LAFAAGWWTLAVVATRAPRRAAAPRPKRQRRSAEEAHEQILDAAERRLAEGGPSGIRLQEIAADVGVSHPTILHHFGSREGLVQAVVQRALAGVRDEIVRVVSERALDASEGAELVRMTAATLGDRGHARLMAWLALEGRTPEDAPQLLRGLAGAMHARRVVETGTEAPPEDTLFMVLLVSLALFGEGVLGDAMRKSAGLEGDATAPARFHGWLARVIEQHLHSAGLVLRPASGPASVVRSTEAGPKAGPRRGRAGQGGKR
jgi:AcrR family transcriptional regulator